MEHDPLEIWRTQLATARDALAKAGIAANAVRAVGITNQRETTVLWNRKTGQPVHHAIVWQDRRAEPACAQLREQGHAATIQAKTGLLVDAYFSGTKLQWMLDHVPGARDAAERGELAFGTVDSWLMWKLTHGQVHVTDVSNAARTMLFNVHTNQWDDELLALLRIPKALLPEVLPSAAHFFGDTAADLLGHSIRIGGVAGDQQSALFGQACFTAAWPRTPTAPAASCSCTRAAPSRHQPNGLLTTSAAQASQQPEFAMEGSVFVAAPWCSGCAMACAPSPTAARGRVPRPKRARFGRRDDGARLHRPGRALLEARRTRHHHRPDARHHHCPHCARALESIAYQSAALLLAMSRDAVAAGAPVSELRVDGGACVNDLLMQFQADLLGIPVVRPAVIETTALGAAYLAGLSSGVYASTDELSHLWRADRRLCPRSATAGRRS